MENGKIKRAHYMPQFQLLPELLSHNVFKLNSRLWIWCHGRSVGRRKGDPLLNLSLKIKASLLRVYWSSQWRIFKIVTGVLQLRKVRSGPRLGRWMFTPLKASDGWVSSSAKWAFLLKLVRSVPLAVVLIKKPADTFFWRDSRHPGEGTVWGLKQ